MSKQTGAAVVPEWIWGMKEDSQVSDLESEVDIWGIHWEREDGIGQGKADRPNNYKSFSARKYNHFIGSFLLSKRGIGDQLFVGKSLFFTADVLVHSSQSNEVF